ncbi:MAG: XRE family transcriptional regulator [Desulfomonilia bacterium]|nr:XRE family transcriptional regulator [Desulfomonilia bacterium]
MIDDHESIGMKIRTYRKHTKTTLDTLSVRTGFTKGYLSKIERGHQSPPIATLSKIANALNVEIADFLERKYENVSCCIVRRTDRKPVAPRGAMFGYTYEALAHKKHDKLMNPFIITLIPHSNDRTVFRHAGQEIMFVLEGSMEFWYGDEKYVLDAGDCVFFDSDTPHRGQCVGERESKVLVVIYSDNPRNKELL